MCPVAFICLEIQRISGQPNNKISRDQSFKLETVRKVSYVSYDAFTRQLPFLHRILWTWNQRWLTSLTLRKQTPIATTKKKTLWLWLDFIGGLPCGSGQPPRNSRLLKALKKTVKLSGWQLFRHVPVSNTHTHTHVVRSHHVLMGCTQTAANTVCDPWQLPTYF